VFIIHLKIKMCWKKFIGIFLWKVQNLWINQKHIILVDYKIWIQVNRNLITRLIKFNNNNINLIKITLKKINSINQTNIILVLVIKISINQPLNLLIIIVITIIIIKMIQVIIVILLKKVF